MKYLTNNTTFFFLNFSHKPDTTLRTMVVKKNKITEVDTPTTEDVPRIMKLLLKRVRTINQKYLTSDHMDVLVPKLIPKKIHPRLHFNTTFYITAVNLPTSYRPTTRAMFAPSQDIKLSNNKIINTIIKRTIKSFKRPGKHIQ